MAEKRGHWSLRLVRPAIDLIVEGTKTMVGHKIVALGASGVGKTTLWTYLELGGTASVDEVEKTLEPYSVGGGRFKVRDVNVSGVKLRLKAVDVPGDADLRKHWSDVLDSLEPRAVVFMLDHAKEGQSLDDRGVKPGSNGGARAAFQEFRHIVDANTDVRESLACLAIMANKCDLWDDRLTYGRLLQYSGIDAHLKDLRGDVSTVAERTSAKYGENVRSTFEWLAHAAL